MCNFIFDMFQYIVLKCPRRYVDGVYAILYEKIQDYPQNIIKTIKVSVKHKDPIHDNIYRYCTYTLTYIIDLDSLRENFEVYKKEFKISSLIAK